jgi:hypothetical protein
MLLDFLNAVEILYKLKAREVVKNNLKEVNITKYSQLE